MMDVLVQCNQRACAQQVCLSPPISSPFSKKTNRQKRISPFNKVEQIHFVPHVYVNKSFVYLGGLIYEIIQVDKAVALRNISSIRGAYISYPPLDLIGSNQHKKGGRRTLCINTHGGGSNCCLPLSRFCYDRLCCAFRQD